jgi:hypothetical protein
LIKRGVSTNLITTPPKIRHDKSIAENIFSRPISEKGQISPAAYATDEGCFRLEAPKTPSVPPVSSSLSTLTVGE